MASIGQLFASNPNLAAVDGHSRARDKYTPAVETALKNLSISQNTLDDEEEVEITAYMEDYEDRLRQGKPGYTFRGLFIDVL